MNFSPLPLAPAVNSAWITGAGGLIGHQLIQTASTFAPKWKVTGLTRAHVDLTNFAAVQKLFQEQRPQLIIHCAAISKSPVCQAHPALAWKINLEVTRCLAELAAKVNFIFFSSDLVFDGKQGGYVETDAPNPLSVYAETKVAAEKIVLANPQHTVVRTSLNAGRSPTGDRAFNEEMRQAWRAGQTLKLFIDEYRCPIPARVTARATWELATQNCSGIYHLAGNEKLSRWQIGHHLAAQYPELHPQMEASSRRDYHGAPRPPDTSLNCEKIQKRLSFPLPKFSEWQGEK